MVSMAARAIVVVELEIDNPSEVDLLTQWPDISILD
jgi:hypothetical protein